MNTQFERSTHTTDEWYTPKEIINALGKFDLDPCAPIAPLWQTAETMYNKIEMNVLSLFDGMSCGQIALKQLGIIPEVYYASEVDKHAIKQTQLNFQIGRAHV